MKKDCGFLLLFSASLLTGCASSSSVASLPSPVSVPQTTPETSTSNTPTTKSWRITPTSQVYSYSSLLVTVTTQADTPGVRRDSLTAHTAYSISTTRNSDSLFFSGAITSFTVQSTLPKTDEARLTFPIIFTGTVSSHNAHTQSSNNRLENTKPCEDISQVPLRTVQRNLFLLPLEILTHNSWSDSTTSLVCSGTMPLIVTSVRTLHVTGETDFEGIPALVFEESEKTFSKGEGFQGQHRIFVESVGITDGHFYADRATGSLLASNTRNMTTLSVQSSGRIQHFLQSSTEVTQRAR